MGARKSFKNIAFGIIGQTIILALGIIVPRFILKSYGDETNGLINAITQIFVYLALIEAGVGQATVQSLYKPIVVDDKKQINSILSTAQKYYRKLTLIYLAIVAIIALIYPVLIRVSDTEAINIFGSSYFAVCMLILIQGSGNAVGFYFTATLKQILFADGRNYIAVNITTLFRVILSVVKILLINIGINLVLLQSIYLLITLSEIAVYLFVFKKYYPWVSLKEKSKSSGLKDKNSFLIHEISNAIFSGTDMLVLSIFCDLTTVSIYAMYNLVFSALSTLIGQVHNGCYYLLGQSYHNDRENYVKVHDTYDTYYIACVFSIMSIAYVLIKPFISLYTVDVTDVNYVDDYLPILFCLINTLSCCRITSSNLIKVSGNAKNTIPRSIIEAVINLIVSLVMVNIIGIYGVLIGTVVALLYRTNDMILYANKNILDRNPIKTYRTVVVNFAIFFVIVAVNHFVQIDINNYLSFFIWAIILTIASVIVFCTINSLVDYKSFKYLKSKIFKDQSLKTDAKQ